MKTIIFHRARVKKSVKNGIRNFKEWPAKLGTKFCAQIWAVCAQFGSQWNVEVGSY